MPPGGGLWPHAAGVTDEGEAARDEDQEAPENEEDLRQQHDELERTVRDNEALEMQLMQSKDDYASLLQDFRSMREYFGRRVTEMSSQLEEQARAAVTWEGHADCLRDLLHFHEEQGHLAGSYWRAQCEKRDDSIHFLTLKLQEYTVLSADYQARRQAMADGGGGSSGSTAAAPPPGPPPRRVPGRQSPSLGRAQSLSAAMPPASAVAASAPIGALRQDLQALYGQHHQLGGEVREREAEAAALGCEVRECELSCAALRVAPGLDWADGGGRLPEMAAALSLPAPEAQVEGDDPGARNEEAESEVRRLHAEVAACEQAACSVPSDCSQLPSWAQRCTWRDELDVRAGQLERISLQFDATKRSLDAANEELQVQASSAETLRMRLADVLRSVRAEEQRTEELRAEHRRSEEAVRELAEQLQGLGRDCAGIVPEHIRVGVLGQGPGGPGGGAAGPPSLVGATQGGPGPDATMMAPLAQVA